MGSTTRPSGEGDGGKDALAGEGRWSPGVKLPPSLPQGTTPGFQDAQRGICVNAGALCSREPTPAVHGGYRYDRGRGRREEKEEGCQAGSSTTPGRRSTRGTAQQDSPTAERVTSVERRRIATREPVEERISTRTRARTRENGMGERTLGRSGDRGHLHRGRPWEGPPPSLEAARLLPSEPRTRTFLSSPPTSDEAPERTTPLQRNIPPSVTSDLSLSSLVPQS